ncbi:hypothetical protein BJX68DRAFT_245647 [Aspergillus pseudodeflectus]|uniref:Uncharacterized protein n=1 Tax=Aspergillus pseudodeflectus TaxID=176178 RepID=A0ABR4JMP0_9EURO
MVSAVAGNLLIIVMVLNPLNAISCRQCYRHEEQRNFPCPPLLLPPRPTLKGHRASFASAVHGSLNDRWAENSLHMLLESFLKLDNNRRKNEDREEALNNFHDIRPKEIQLPHR